MSFRHEGMVPLILQHGIRWRWVASYLNRPLYSWGKNPGTQWTRGYLDPIDCGKVIFYIFPGSNIHSSVVQSIACIARMSFPTRHVKWNQPSAFTYTTFQYRQITLTFMGPEGQACQENINSYHFTYMAITHTHSSPSPYTIAKRNIGARIFS
jgi:hypothetical protein